MAISPTQAKLIAALLSERSPGAACTVASVSTRTYRHWVQFDTAFVAELEHAQQRVIDESIASVVAASTQAVRELHRILDDIMTPPLDKLDSIKFCLEFATSATEKKLLLKRIVALEQRNVTRDEEIAAARVETPRNEWVTIDGNQSRSLASEN